MQTKKTASFVAKCKVGQNELLKSLWPLSIWRHFNVHFCDFNWKRWRKTQLTINTIIFITSRCLQKTIIHYTISYANPALTCWIFSVWSFVMRCLSASHFLLLLNQSQPLHFLNGFVFHSIFFQSKNHRFVRCRSNEEHSFLDAFPALIDRQTRVKA